MKCSHSGFCCDKGEDDECGAAEDFLCNFKMMTAEDDAKLRKTAIQTIEGLFPTDSPYPDTNQVGELLLTQAKRGTWRNEPTDVLLRYAELCQAEENRQASRKRM